MMSPALTPVESGQRAPDFVVSAVHEDRTISLADYRGKSPLLLGLFPGLYCPFCRRALAQMATSSRELNSQGVDVLAIVGTDLENARLYFKYRPTSMPLGADPQLTTHRSYGVPRPEPTPELMQMVQAVLRQPDRRTAGAASDTGCCRSTLRVGWLHADTNRHSRSGNEVHATQGSVPDRPGRRRAVVRDRVRERGLLRIWKVSDPRRID